MNGAEVCNDPVVVVGAGILGVCCALDLLRNGYRLVLLDRTAPGEGASFGNGSTSRSWFPG